MEEFTEEYKYKNVKSKVDNLRAFYIHITVYVIVNTCISVAKIIHNLANNESLREAIFDFATIAIWMFWGVAIAFHAFSVFGIDYILGKNWEVKRIKKYMEEYDRQ